VRWIASYTRAWRHLDGTWQPNDPASFIQPNAFANDGGLGSVSASDSDSLTGTTMFFGNAPWRDHVARVGVIVTAPWQVNVAANVTYQSGAFSGPVVTRLAAADPAFGPQTVQLSNGRVVSNPLATPIRFAYATRGDGQLTLPALRLFNLRVGRSWSLGMTRRVELAAEVFNLANEDADQTFVAGANQLYSTNYSLTRDRQAPRSMRLSARVAF
jgi:hypothetical protein